MIVYGINPVLEALRAGRVTAVQVSERGGPRVREIAEQAAQAGARVRWVEPAALDRTAHGGAHQGVIAELRPPESHGLDDLIRKASQPPLFVVLDGIEDPQNFGAIVRTCDAVDVDGIVRQTRHAAALGAAAAKASAGALAHARIADVVNIARAIEELKAAGVWTIGLAAEGGLPYDELDLTLPIAFVLGAEGRGLRRLVRERCDWLAFIPMRGQVSSLNVSVAAGVALFEAARQRRAKRRLEGGPAGRI